MSYLKVKWNRSFPDEPMLLYSELDRDVGRFVRSNFWRERKIETVAAKMMGEDQPGGLLV
jgi:hypothetical protein